MYEGIFLEWSKSIKFNDIMSSSVYSERKGVRPVLLVQRGKAMHLLKKKYLDFQLDLVGLELVTKGRLEFQDQSVYSRRRAFQSLNSRKRI